MYNVSHKIKRTFYIIICSLLFLIIIINSIFFHKTTNLVNDFTKRFKTSNNYTILSQQERIDKLWRKTVSQALSDNLWNDLYSYDATSYLLIPMHYAFKSDDSNKIAEFRFFFERFLNENFFISYKNENRLTRIQFIFFASEFLKQDVDNYKNMVEYKTFINLISKNLSLIWREIPAWQWEQPNFDGMKNRLDWKLNNKETEESYYRAIIDEELFVFAAAANIIYIQNAIGVKTDSSYTLDDILEYADYIFLNEIEMYEDGRWLLQPGVWTDLVSYKYAGTEETPKEGFTYKVQGIASDTSHSHRMPIWLISLRDAHKNIVKINYYNTLLKGLERQLITNVFKKININGIDMHVTTNYLDGVNGYYRWDDKTKTGYKPYGLSGTLTLGWWSLLESKYISGVYKDILVQFPLSKETLEFYLEPRISRERHELFKDVNSYTNGFRELNVLLASLF